MIPAERQQLIVARLGERGIVSIAALTELLGVSHMTVRRDIQQLEREGRVTSVAGGIQLPVKISIEPSHVAKAAMAHREKVAIARLAATLVQDNTVIYLDAGTTTLEIARLITARENIDVVTNDFAIVAYLARESRCRLYHTGGEVERENQSAVGDCTALAIRQFNFDIAFISTSSFALRGVSTPSENKVAVKRAIVHSARRSVLVTDSSKYGRLGTFNVVPLDALSDVIIDSGLPDDVCAAIRDRGPALHVVQPDALSSQPS